MSNLALIATICLAITATNRGNFETPPTGMNHSLAAAWFALDCLFHALVDPHRKKAR